MSHNLDDVITMYIPVYFSPRAQHVLIGGGQDARDVTTTSSRDGKFEARFFHM